MSVIPCVVYSALSLNFVLRVLRFRKAIYYYYYYYYYYYLHDHSYVCACKRGLHLVPTTLDVCMSVHHNFHNHYTHNHYTHNHYTHNHDSGAHEPERSAQCTFYHLSHQ